MIKVLLLEIRIRLKTLILSLRSSNKIKNTAELISFPFTSVHSLKEFKINPAEIHSFYTYYLTKTHILNTLYICIKK